jgi:hypothetical protein
VEEKISSNDIAGQKSRGTYIGQGSFNGMAPRPEHNYVYSNGDGTWTLHRQDRNTDVNTEEGPYDAQALLKALKEHGFSRDQIIAKGIEGLDLSSFEICDKCDSVINLVNPDVNRCSNCGVEYDGDGNLITQVFICPVEWCRVFIMSKERNECYCGLAYDGEGNPVVTMPPRGTFIGNREWWNPFGMASEDCHYIYSNGDGTWMHYRHYSEHPDINDELGPFTAEELLEDLKEFEFDVEEILEQDIAGLSSALKKMRPRQ